MLRRAWSVVFGLSIAGPGCGADEEPVAPAAPAVAEAVCAHEAPPPERPGSLAGRIGTKIERVAQTCRVDPMASATEVDTRVSGAWEGHYAYTDPGRSPTAIEVTLDVRSGRLSGTMREPNTFGAAGWSHLTSDLVGHVSATGEVAFMKTYNNAGVDHSVLYVGAIDREDLAIEGQWMLGSGVGSSQGTFELSRHE